MPFQPSCKTFQLDRASRSLRPLCSYIGYLHIFATRTIPQAAGLTFNYWQPPNACSQSPLPALDISSHYSNKSQLICFRNPAVGNYKHAAAPRPALGYIKPVSQIKLLSPLPQDPTHWMAKEPSREPTARLHQIVATHTHTYSTL